LFQPLNSNLRAIRTKVMIWLLKRPTVRFSPDVPIATAGAPLSGDCLKSDKDGATITSDALTACVVRLPEQNPAIRSPEWNLLAAL